VSGNRKQSTRNGNAAPRNQAERKDRSRKEESDNQPTNRRKKAGAQSGDQTTNTGARKGREPKSCRRFVLSPPEKGPGYQKTWNRRVKSECFNDGQKQKQSTGIGEAAPRKPSRPEGGSNVERRRDEMVKIEKDSGSDQTRAATAAGELLGVSRDRRD
jgi:hypothetical protein